MAQLTSQQANDLAGQFLAMGQAIGDFRYLHWNILTMTQHQQLARLHSAVLNSGEDILALSTTLVLDEVEASLATIRGITGQIKSTLATLGDIQQGIDLATSVVALGASVISRSPSRIEKALEDLVKRWKKF